MSRGALPVALVALVAFGTVAGAIGGVSTAPDPRPSDESHERDGVPAAGGGPPEDTARNGSTRERLGLRPRALIAGLVPDAPAPVLLGAAALACLLLALLARGRGGDAHAEETGETDGLSEASRDERNRIAPAAGDPPAADPVSRAWASTVGQVGPETATPRERAERVGTAAARRLTALFERVRYGGRAPSEDEAERARAAADRVREERTDA